MHYLQLSISNIAKTAPKVLFAQTLKNHGIAILRNALNVENEFCKFVILVILTHYLGSTIKRSS